MLEIISAHEPLLVSTALAITAPRNPFEKSGHPLLDLALVSVLADDCDVRSLRRKGPSVVRAVEVEPALVPGIRPSAARVEDEIRLCDDFGSWEPDRFCLAARKKLPDGERHAGCQVQLAVAKKVEQLANSLKLLLAILKSRRCLIGIPD